MSTNSNSKKFTGWTGGQVQAVINMLGGEQGWKDMLANKLSVVPRKGPEVEKSRTDLIQFKHFWETFRGAPNVKTNLYGMTSSWGSDGGCFKDGFGWNAVDGGELKQELGAQNTQRQKIEEFALHLEALRVFLVEKNSCPPHVESLYRMMESCLHYMKEAHFAAWGEGGVNYSYTLVLNKINSVQIYCRAIDDMMFSVGKTL